MHIQQRPKIRRNLHLLTVLFAATLTPAAMGEITDLTVENPEVLQRNTFALGCPISSKQLAAKVDELLARRNIQPAHLDTYDKIFYSASLFCKKPRDAEYIFIIQTMFQISVNGKTMAFSEQGYQVYAGVGGPEEMLNEYTATVSYSLRDYVRQNKTLQSAKH